MTTAADLAVPKSELAARIARLQRELQSSGAGAALIVQKTDLFYFSGTSQQGWLYVPVSGEPLLMIFKDFDRAVAETGLDRVCSVAGAREIPQTLAAYGYETPAAMGLELDVLPVNLFLQYRKIFPKTELVDASTGIRLIRAVKSDWEIERLRAAAACSDLVSAKVPELLAVGKTEIEVAGELEAYARSLGHQGIVRMRLWGAELFYGHLLSGADAATPSYLASPTGGTGPSRCISQGAGFKKIAAGEPVIVDYVFALHGYLSDHTRVFCIGSLPEELLNGHKAMLEIQETVKNRACPGVTGEEIYQLMIAAARDNGYGDWFMGVGDRRIRFTGHGIGLELDEFPFIAQGQKLKLERNMVIALEPKLIIPGKGVVGIENTHVVTEGGLEPLTRAPDAITFL